MDSARTILVVDDEQDVLLYLSTLFEDNGFNSITAENGIQALEKAKSVLPDLIILAITMPGPSEIGTYRLLKNDHRLQDVPVIVIVAVGDPIQQIKTMLADIQEPEAFISKPFDHKGLIETTDRLLHQAGRPRKGIAQVLSWDS